MNKTITKNLLFLSTILCIATIAPKTQNNILVASLMIKDEAHCIEKTLQPLVDGGVTNFFIFDTGSTDGTQKIVKGFFKKHSLNGKLTEEPFVDFSTSRNRALELTEQNFPSCPFILMLDANWYVKHVPEMLAFCQQQKYNPMPSYFMEVEDHTPWGINRYRSSRIFRTDAHVRYHGSVHEHIDNEKIFPDAQVPSPVVIEQIPGDQGEAKSAARFERDCKLLHKDLEKDPTNSRAAYYLAQSYACKLDFKNAYTYYKMRTQMPGYDEETYLAWYRLACMALLLMPDHPQYTWQEAQQYFLTAHSLRPWRAEPLVRIAQYYLNSNNHALAYIFARRACELPIPLTEREAMDHRAYTFERYDVLGITAWSVGMYDIGEWATREALKVEPNAQHLKKNLKLYEKRKAASYQVDIAP